VKTIHFISGLPRSGSTLLANLLAQNPRFQAAGTSGLVDMLFTVRNAWDTVPEFLAMSPKESEAAKLRVLRGMAANYHAGHDRPVVFDKSRSWLAYLEMAETILEHPAKVLVPVRDLRDVLASMELLWRRLSATRQFPHERANFYSFQCAEDRCQYWTGPRGTVGIAQRRVHDAFLRGFGDRLHLVHFERLTSDPAGTMAAIYEFLGESPYAHDFKSAWPATTENDLAYGMPGLHATRLEVESRPSQWEEVLGDAVRPYFSACVPNSD
jgi:sulfotransferase